MCFLTGDGCSDALKVLRSLAIRSVGSLRSDFLVVFALNFPFPTFSNLPFSSFLPPPGLPPHASLPTQSDLVHSCIS